MTNILIWQGNKAGELYLGKQFGNFPVPVKNVPAKNQDQFLIYQKNIWWLTPAMYSRSIMTRLLILQGYKAGIFFWKRIQQIYNSYEKYCHLKLGWFYKLTKNIFDCELLLSCTNIPSLQV